MRFRPSLTLLFLAVAVPSAAMAQETAPRAPVRLFIGYGVGGYLTDNPHGGVGLKEVSGGAEREIRPGMVVRAALRRTVPMKNVGFNAVCIPRPDDSCWPSPEFPSRLWALELGGVMAIARGAPVAAVVGLGVAIPVDGPDYTIRVGSTPLHSFVRLGAEFWLGGGPGGIRLAISRVFYPGNLLDMTGQFTVGLSLR
ncbi:MAG: hypothetical protein ABR551_00095 [Gemmatimonadales bacterium]